MVNSEKSISRRKFLLGLGSTGIASFFGGVILSKNSGNLISKVEEIAKNSPLFVETVPYPGDYEGFDKDGNYLKLKRDETQTTLYIDEREVEPSSRENGSDKEGWEIKFIDYGNNGLVDKRDYVWDPSDWFFLAYHRDQPDAWDRAGLPKGTYDRRADGDDMEDAQKDYNNRLIKISGLIKGNSNAA